MASIKYGIKKGTTRIYILITTGRNGFQLRKSLNKSLVNAKNWSDKKQQVKVTNEEPEAKNINQYVSNHRNQILKGIADLERKDANYLPSKKDYNRIIDGIDGSVFIIRKTKGFDFTTLLNEFIHKAKTGEVKKPKVMDNYTSSTLKGYRTLCNKIEEFERQEYKLTPSNISEEFQLDFVNYYQEHYENSYIDKLLDNFTAFIDNYLIGKLKLSFPKYNPTVWMRLPATDTLNTYLSIPELTKLTYLDLSSKDEHWQRVRDLYCFNAFTCGMRVNDLMRMKEHNIVTKMIEGEKRHYLSFRQRKTNKPVKAPISGLALKILQKYGGRIPHINSATESNEILKKLGKMAGFTEWLDPIVDKDNKVLKKKRKYELLTNHTARRSFCTNCYNAGVDIVQIMAISGHSNPNIMLGYIGVTLDEYADKMTETNYFKTVDRITEDMKMKAV